MNTLLLMAGGSDAFYEAGYHYPKNLIEIEGLPIIQRVIENLEPILQSSKLICILQKDENQKNFTGSVIKLLVNDVEIVEVPQTTAGAACTALLAISLINNDDPLLIANGDQFLDIDIQMIIADFQHRNLDGGIVVFEAVHPRWSYVKCAENGYVIETAEKRPISNLATAGMYYFKRGRDFVQACMDMIKKGDETEGKYFICPVYNQLILKQAKVGIYKIPRDKYFSLATPKGVQAYEEFLRFKLQRGWYANR